MLAMPLGVATCFWREESEKTGQGESKKTPSLHPYVVVYMSGYQHAFAREWRKAECTLSK